MAQAYFKITLFDELDDQAQLITLTSNPAGMLDLEITYKKHELYNTVFRNFGDTLRFPDTGRYIDGYYPLKSMFEANGIDANCTIKIYTLVDSNKSYELSYTGLIDFSTYSEDENYIQVGVIDNSTMAKFLAREEVSYNILDETNAENIDNPTLPNPYDCELTPIIPVYRANGNGILEEYYTAASPTGSQITYYLDYTSSTNTVGSDLNESTFIFTNNYSSAVATTLDFILSLRLLGHVNITTWNPPYDPDVYMYIQVYIYQDYDNTLIHSFEERYTGLGSQPVDYEFTDVISIARTIAASGTQGIRVVVSTGKMGVSLEVSGTWDFGVRVDAYQTSFSYTDPFNSITTSTIGYRLLDVGNMLLNQMALPDNLDFDCPDFENEGEFGNILFMGGKNIRKFPDSTPINISFRAFFEACSAVFGHLMYFTDAGFTFKNPTDYYAPNTGGITISIYSNLVTDIATSKYFSSMKVGYKKYSYKDVNGGIEFNNKFQFGTVTSNIKNTIDKISEVRTDSIGIESLKRKLYINYADEDVDGDDDNFFISTIFDGTRRAEIGSDIGTITGLDKPYQYYNYRLTPKSNLVRQGYLLNTTLQYQDKEVKYVSSTNNIPLVINGLAELDGEYNSSETGSVKPIYKTFDTILTPELLEFLKNRPEEEITIANVCSGFLEEATINLYKKTANIKMIQYS